MDREKAKKLLREKRERELEAEKAEMIRKAQKFKERPGKVIRWMSLFLILYSSLFLIDCLLDVTYKSYEIKGAKPEIYRVVSGDGGYVPSTYYHVFLDEQQNFNIFMYKQQYFVASIEGKVDVGLSPIFGTTKSFRVGPESMRFEKPIEYSLHIDVVISCFFILFGLFGLLLKFETNQQTIIFGHFCFFTLPLFIVIITVLSLGRLNHNGSHVMDISSLELSSFDEQRVVLKLAPEGTEDGTAWK